MRRLQHESTDCSKRYLEDGHDRLLVADSSGSPPSPKAAFGNARLFARTAAYGFRCELTLSANSGSSHTKVLVPAMAGLKAQQT